MIGYEGGFELSADNADIADTLHVRDVAMATSFWLLMGFNFSCIIGSDTRFLILGVGFRVKLSDEDSRFRGSKGR